MDGRINKIKKGRWKSVTKNGCDVTDITGLILEKTKEKSRAQLGLRVNFNFVTMSRVVS